MKLILIACAGAVWLTLQCKADILNVRTWNSNPSLNAKGDGRTDDAYAVQQAIYSLTNGGTLYFPSGTYLLNSNVNTGTVYYQNYALSVTNQNLTIEGDGPGTVLLQTNCATTLIYAHFSGNVAGLTLQNFSFQGDTNSDYVENLDSYASGRMLACTGVAQSAGWSAYLRVKNVSSADEGKRGVFYIFNMTDVIIEGCRFLSTFTNSAPLGHGFPAVFVSQEGLGALKLINNYFDGGNLTNTSTSGSDGLIYQQAGTETVIAGNIIRNFRLEGVQANPARLTITGNSFLGNSDPSCVAISITPDATLSDTNVQVTVNGNVARGCLSFISTDPRVSTDIVRINCIVEGNDVKLGNRETGLPGGMGIKIIRGHRVVIRGNSLDNYSNTSALQIGGTGLMDSSLDIEGNLFTNPTNNSVQYALWLNYPVGGSVYGSFFHNLIVRNNTINACNGGHMWIYGNTNSASFPGRVLIGDNIYTTGDNVLGTPYIFVQNPSNAYIPISAGMTTNWGNYIISDVGPD